MTQEPHVSLVVSNWQGAAWLRRGISALQLSLHASRLPGEIIVVDDASTDGSADLIRAAFPRVTLLVNKRNRGFGATTMRGVRAARGRIVILCNNDLVPQESFVANLCRWFDQSQVRLDDGTHFPGKRLFGVSARTLAWWDGQPNQVCMGGVFRGGRLTPAWSQPTSATRCLFTQAGAAAYDRQLFLKLGGLHPVFAPGYWEDYDITYAAAKQGYHSLYDPEAVALHHGGGSMVKRYGAKRVERLKARNHLLFEWMNLTDGAMVVRHAAGLVVGVGREWLRGRTPLLSRALLDAMRLAPRIVRTRLERSRTRQRTDAAVIRPYRDWPASY